MAFLLTVVMQLLHFVLFSALKPSRILIKIALGQKYFMTGSYELVNSNAAVTDSDKTFDR